MPAPYRRSHPALDVAITALVAVVFVVDVTTPLGIATWLFYVVPIGASLFTSRPTMPLLAAVAATAFTLIDYWVSPDGIGEHVAELNRIFGVATFWALAVGGQQSIRARRAMQAQEWIRSGQARMSANIQGDITTGELAERALGWLAEYVDAAVGALYVGGASGLRRAATHGVAEGTAPLVVGPGDGLVGQAALDRRLRHLADLPADYLPVRSSVGGRAPLHVLIVPVDVGDTTHGVIELGLFRPPIEPELELIRLITEPLAVGIRSAEYRDRLRELLEETRRQAEQLQSQQEELRVTNEELEQQAAVLREARAQQERVQAELEETNASLEEQTSLLEAQKNDLEVAQRDLAAKADELARASRYKSEFLANMSHELRTPLNSSLILARLLADNAPGNLTAEQVEFAETIYAAGNDLLAMINDILDLAKVEAGRVELHVGVVPLARVRDVLRRTFEPVAARKGLKLTVEVDPSAPSTIDTDEQRVMQVLKNLLANACKFTERGEVAMTVRGDDARVRIDVRDTGIGIPADQQELIFEAFQQADGTTSRRYGGTGLGLTISRDLARLLGGELSVESAPGHGSTFTLIIPRAIAPGARRAANGKAAALAAARPPAPAPRAPAVRPAAPAAAPPVAPPHVADDRDAVVAGERRLLIIEDDAEFARILVELGRELGFQCVAAATAEEGLSLAERHRPHGILLDIRLPDDSGLAVLERLKRRPATRHIPVHVISIEDFDRRAREMGAIGYLLKPVARDQLVDAIRRLEDRFVPRVRRLMIAEDDPVHRDALCHLLGGERIELTAVATVKDALDQLRATTFDCVVLDLTLADGTGFDLLEQMAADEGLSFPPVIVHTGRALSDDEEQRLRRYSSSIIVKGARSPERLLDEVTLFLHQVEAELPADRQRMLREARDREAVFDGRTVMIVEDDVRNVFALTSVLEPKGIRTMIARNGREALELLDQHDRVDLILMDIMMPEMDGLEATRRIRTRREWAKLPVLALTAKVMNDDRERCLEAGASDYLAKPIDVEKLLSLLRVWMPR